VQIADAPQQKLKFGVKSRDEAREKLV